MYRIERNREKERERDEELGPTVDVIKMTASSGFRVSSNSTVHQFYLVKPNDSLICIISVPIVVHSLVVLNHLL
jgi:hypothetical protein